MSGCSQKPIYEQIYEQIVAAIVTGALVQHECLPSMRAMARELNVSVITTQKTYEKLEADGFTYSVPGKGCFVSERRQSRREDKSELAKAKLAEQIPYLKSIGISRIDAVALLEKLWED